MANVRILCYAIFGILLQFNKSMARTSTSIIEAYKPTTSTTTKTKDETREEENLNKLDKMLITLEHKIQDINFRRRIMEQQRKFPINSFTARMEAALDITDLSPSIVYTNQKIVSGNGVFLQIFPNGNANGTRDDSSPYTNLTIEMVGLLAGAVKILIKGEMSNKYLTCNAKGKFQALPTRSYNGVFLTPQPPKPQESKKNYSLWKSKKYTNLKCEKYGWLLGFRHNFKLKKGRHARERQLDSWFMIL
ncbi:fibroblast growth factor 13-like [Xenia sp. Carnegie-2017]|uniref:fibroblast growth factor 13-like n=1 Tax=Xenia sp. Carnegie-2017 TaxID=2897299 RepID=UPI001F03B0B2|nr:fibroblast growth factor 13-like [Xenia sp. Carnegie-2017]